MTQRRIGRTRPIRCAVNSQQNIGAGPCGSFEDVVRINPPKFATHRFYRRPVDITFYGIEVHILNEIGVAQIGQIHPVAKIIRGKCRVAGVRSGKLLVRQGQKPDAGREGREVVPGRGAGQLINLLVGHIQRHYIVVAILTAGEKQPLSVYRPAQ